MPKIIDGKFVLISSETFLKRWGPLCQF